MRALFFFFFFFTAVYGAALLRDANDGPAPRELKPAETEPAAISPADDLFSRQSGRGPPMCFLSLPFRSLFDRFRDTRTSIRRVIRNRRSRTYHFHNAIGVDISVTIDATRMTDQNRSLRVSWVSRGPRSGFIYLTNYPDRNLESRSI